MTVILLAVAVGWDASGLDLAFAHLAGGAAGFPLRDSWWLATVLHDGARRLSWLLALALCLGVWWPFGPLARLTPGERTQLAVTTLACAIIVTLLRAASPASCPWELTDFGGVAHYASHWRLRADGGPGHCFPAGHAAAGFSFVGGYFAFRRYAPAIGRRWLAASLLAGLVFGLTQQWRGADFMSDTWWTAVLCWGIAGAIDLAWPRARSPERT